MLVGPSLNPMRSVGRVDPWTAAGVILGIGAIAGGLWWWLDSDPVSPPNPLGHILCPVTPYDGRIERGDYVVVQLQSTNKQFSEPTWAEVQRTDGNQLKIRIAGESAQGASGAVPLSTGRHGFKIGDVLTISSSCVFDRYRPGQAWTVLCGQRLADAGVTPVSKTKASALGQGDDAMVFVNDAAGTEGLWLRVGQVSTGHQTIFGTVLYPTALDSVRQGDTIEFLRDCVVDAVLR